MRYRTFGRTGLRISTVSMGSNRLGDPGVDPSQWPPIVQRALDLGISFFDTSNSYNQGRSEEVLGEVASGLSDVYVSTKVGVPVLTNDFPNREFSEESIFREVVNSCERLRRQPIDIYMLHSPSVSQLKAMPFEDVAKELKARGYVRYFGISTDDHASGIWAINHGADVLQIEYNLLDPTAEDELLPLAVQNDVGVMVRVPLARGLLTGKFPAGQSIPVEQQWRRPKGDQLQRRLARVDQLRFLERAGQTLAAASLRYILSQPGIHCVIPGARTVSQLEANAAAADGDLTANELERIRALHAEWRAEGVW